MFQFPGFALMTLCIQVKSTWFTPLLTTPPRNSKPTKVGTECPSRSDNNRVSGGLPHSEIQGSKPITGSPWLIAGYHVLHRLLLPRHPPNALFALDLIQKKQDCLSCPTALARYVRTGLPSARGPAAIGTSYDLPDPRLLYDRGLEIKSRTFPGIRPGS